MCLIDKKDIESAKTKISMKDKYVFKKVLLPWGIASPEAMCCSCIRQHNKLLLRFLAHLAYMPMSLYNHDLSVVCHCHHCCHYHHWCHCCHHCWCCHWCCLCAAVPVTALIIETSYLVDISLIDAHEILGQFDIFYILHFLAHIHAEDTNFFIPHPCKIWPFDWFIGGGYQLVFTCRWIPHSSVGEYHICSHVHLLLWV